MIFAVLLLFAALLAIRYTWANHHAQGWMTVCITYVAIVGRDTEWTPEEKLLKILDYSHVWPMSQMMSRFWIWDFRRFIVHQEIMPIIVDFFLKHPQSQSR